MNNAVMTAGSPVSASFKLSRMKAIESPRKDSERAGRTRRMSLYDQTPIRDEEF
jgi:hypothetical protein